MELVDMPDMSPFGSISGFGTCHLKRVGGDFILGDRYVEGTQSNHKQDTLINKFYNCRRVLEKGYIS